MKNQNFETFRYLNITEQLSGVVFRVTAKCKVTFNRDNSVNIKVGFAACSPNDRYNKALGKTIANSRFEHKPSHIYLTAAEVKQSNGLHIKPALFAFLTTNSNLIFRPHGIDNLDIFAAKNNILTLEKNASF